VSEAITIPGYEILLKIGEGSTSTIWRARQESLDREVAIKVLKPQLVGEEDEVQAFLREARAVAKLKSPNIIKVYDVGQYEDTLYIVMECVNGHPLTTLLDLGDPIIQKRALAITLAVAQALADAWNAEKIIHRDIKPDNIIIEKGGGVKIADLGLSGIVDAKGGLVDETPGLIVGTPNYMSPEQANASESVSFTSDMYSLGAVLYHMVTGQIPFAGREVQEVLQAQIEEQLPFPQDINPDVTPPCAQLIARLMMKDPRQRYPDWQSAMNDIAKLAEGKIIVVKPLAGAGSTIAAKGGSTPRKKIITRPPTRETATPGAAARKIIPRTPGASPAAPASARIIAGSASPPLSAAETAARAAALKKKYGKPTTPLWIKLPLAAALVALFGWLGLSLLWQPYRDAYPHVAVNAPAAAEPLPPPSSRPRPVPSATALSESTDPLDYIADPVPPPRPERPAYTPPPAAEPPAPRLDALKNSLVNIALSEGLDEAAERLRQQQDSSPAAAKQLAELARFFAPSNQPEAIIADAFRNLVGKETYVNMGGRRIEFRVEAVNGDTISTMVKSSSGGSVVYRPAELKVSQLEPEEQRRWLGDAATPEKAFAAAMLDLSTANYADVARQAQNCGALADATREFAQKRIDMLLE